jgi:hypothetical protein
MCPGKVLGKTFLPKIMHLAVAGRRYRRIQNDDREAVRLWTEWKREKGRLEGRRPNVIASYRTNPLAYCWCSVR